MDTEALDIEGAYLIRPERHADERGEFVNVWTADALHAIGFEGVFRQYAVASNHLAGTFRGMHYRRPPHGEAKHVQCLDGKIQDFIIDLRSLSPTFKKVIQVPLTANSSNSIFVPQGCAHGYQTLVDNTTVAYHLAESFQPDVEAGIRHNDPTFNLSLPLPISCISSKDELWPTWSENNE